ncbi:MAG TPA: tRNA pseudouridine(38-40) synthase TruA [Actinomycetota bacterium]
MTRTIRLDIAYDGTGFRGWAAQRDPAVRTIQGELTTHLERVLRERVRLTVAGRTDAGVHARGQVASFVTDATVAAHRIQAAVNGALAPEIVVTSASEVAAGFDARRSASAREYAYRIDTHELADPFTARYVWHRPGALHAPSMREGARHMVGEHDFASFCRHPGEGRTTVRRVRRLSVARRGDVVEIRVVANAFLQQMVRVVVGTLVAVGEGRIDPAAVAAILDARDRAGAGRPAPAHGLTLERVVYGRREHP